MVIRIILSLVFLLFPVVAGAAEPKIFTKTNYYDVEGTTAWELRKELDKKGPEPSRYAGKRFSATTTVDINWSYELLYGKPGCYVKDVGMVLDITFIMPRWVERDRKRSDPLLQETWDHYIERLQYHEDGHKELGIKSGERIAEAMKSVAAQKDCETLEMLVKKAAGEFVAKSHDVHEEYDRRTNHGETQGVKFP